MRILIVDDHEIVRRGVAQVLGSGFPDATLVEAGEADAALRALEAGPRFDLATVDVHLPGRSGLELLDDLRARWRELPVLMLSVHGEEEYAARCLRRGAAGYLTKGSAAQELLAAARKVLGGGRYVTAALAEQLAAIVGGEVQPAPDEALSRRELEVLRAVAEGHTLKQIAAQLGLSEKTVASYRARIAVKLGLHSNVELTRYALRHGLCS